MVQRPQRLLIVEDNADLNLALKSFLRSFGYRTWFAADVASALHIAARQPFDILLSDIGLPDGDGWNLRQQLVRMNVCPPHTVAMSSFSMAEHQARSKAVGYCRHLVKPFDPLALLEALNATVLPATGERSLTAVACEAPRGVRPIKEGRRIVPSVV